MPWNDLSASVVKSANINIFKKRLDTVNLQKYCKYFFIDLTLVPYNYISIHMSSSLPIDLLFYLLYVITHY